MILVEAMSEVDEAEAEEWTLEPEPEEEEIENRASFAH